jgi:hypothetical protein
MIIIYNMNMREGTTEQISLKDLLIIAFNAHFTGRLTLNKGEHFCMLEFANGNATGAFGWKLEGDDALIHLFLEKPVFPFLFSLPVEYSQEDTKPIALPRGTQHILELLNAIENKLYHFKGAVKKRIVINENINNDLDLTAGEMKEILRFTQPVPIASFLDGRNLKETLLHISALIDKKLLIIIG